MAPGDEVPDADFGYAWTEDNDKNGAIGDRVWIDADGDGVQDPGELGLEGVVVELYEADGVTLITTTTTAADGSYIFDDLAEGNYVVKVDTGTLPAGYTQTGDPDYFGASIPSGQEDNKTTAPVTKARATACSRPGTSSPTRGTGTAGSAWSATATPSATASSCWRAAGRLSSPASRTPATP